MDKENNIKKLTPKKAPETNKKPGVAGTPGKPQGEDPWSNLTATERIEVLRTNQLVMLETQDALMQQNSMLVGHIERLQEQVRAIVKIADDGKDLSSSTLKTTVEERNVAELSKKVDDLVKSGILEKVDEPIGEESFVVGFVKDDAGEVINPRLQMLVKQVLGKDYEILIGKKAGESCKFEGGGIFEIQEVYRMTNMTPIPPGKEKEVDRAIEEEESKIAEDGIPQSPEPA